MIILLLVICFLLGLIYVLLTHIHAHQVWLEDELLKPRDPSMFVGSAKDFEKYGFKMEGGQDDEPEV